MKELIDEVHNAVVGHHGVERTFNKLVAQGHHWPFMREHVKYYVRKCHVLSLLPEDELRENTHTDKSLYNCRVFFSRTPQLGLYRTNYIVRWFKSPHLSLHMLLY